jgi:hypothetical protein
MEADPAPCTAPKAVIRNPVADAKSLDLRYL